jgi:uncharacterized membrane protein
MTCTKGKSMAKTVSFALVHMSVAFAVGYAMTGSLAIGGALALFEPLFNTVAYFFHEKAWAIAGRPRTARDDATKTLTFAAVHMSVAFAVGYAMTGSAAIGGALALVEPLVNTIAYFLHERAWSLVGRAGHATTRDHASKKSGNVFETQPGSLIRIGTGPKAASAKHIAMRWSS